MFTKVVTKTVTTIATAHIRRTAVSQGVTVTEIVTEFEGQQQKSVA